MTSNEVKRPFLSAIFLIDEFPYLECLPWRESVHSVLNFVDELIVVHGGKRNADGRQPAMEYLKGLNDARIRLMVFPWPANFDWRQIALSCTFGHLHAGGQWCMRVLADEVFPDEFAGIRWELERQPEHVKIVSVARLYMLGNLYACPFNNKPLFFRNDRSIGYGTVNPAQGDAASYGLFDDPLETDRWFDGHEIVSIADQSLLRDGNGLERLRRGEVPRGYRGESTSRMTVSLPIGVLNVDVNFFSDNLLLDQKELSQQGYQRLPQEYPHRPVLSRAELGIALEKKISDMMTSFRLTRVKLPEPLNQFIDRQEATVNRVRQLCEDKCGLPWNRVSGRASAMRRLATLSRNAMCRYFCRISL